MTVFGLRISCPDRPGSLGAVATALGEVEANILSVDVMERDGEHAVDQLVVDAPTARLDALVDVVESVPEVVVEVVHTVPRVLRQAGVLEVAANVLDATDALEVVVDGVVEALDASWAVAVRQRTPQPEVVAATAGAPTLVGAGTPWLPVSGCRRLGVGRWVPSRWSLDPAAATFAVAPLQGPWEALLVARVRGPVFRAGELDTIGQLARIAAQVAMPQPDEPPLGTQPQP